MYLVTHYVAPQLRCVGKAGAALLGQPRDGSDAVAELEPGAAFEALDFAGEWCWGCRGPEGPTGYLRTALLAPPPAT